VDDSAPYRVVATERRTTTIRELWLRPLAASLKYRPGEYVLIEDADRGIPPRSYSIANAPRPDGLISLLVTRVRDGQTSTWIHDHLRVGEEVIVSGPYGTFVDNPASTAPCLLLAAGSGLAPIRSLLEAALSTGPRRSVTLIVSARTDADVIDCERFTDWQDSHPRFRFVHTITRADGPSPRGRIPAVLPSVCAELVDHDVFIAGAPDFVRATATAAMALGARPERIHTEAFFVEALA
jgi:CDP-4-dehydro-6-deoxyglucose reductase